MNQHLDEATQSLKSGQVNKAVELLLAAMQQMNEREERRAAYAHGLIAENTFAIVRLEIAQATDQIINNVLLVKRDRTGSGNAEFALNVTGTLAMLSGNVLSGGSMSLLGNLLVAAGEMVQAAAKNDTAGLGKSMTHAAVKTSGGSELIMTVGDGVFEVGGQLYDRFKEVSKSPDTYTVVKKKTARIKHGAGGTNAITYDVQEAITAAYAQGLQKVCDEFKTIGKTNGRAKLEPTSILGQLLTSHVAAKAELHPMTVWVINQAMQTLAQSGGKHYQLLTGGSGVFGRESELTRAKHDVKAAYSFMAQTREGFLVEIDTIRAHIKTIK